jgi:PAS domain S-box-containing protein
MQILHNQQLQRALAGGKIGTWELDLATRVLTSSAQCKANFGRSAEDLFPYDDLVSAVHPDDRHLLEQAVRGAINGGKECAAQYRCIWPDGSLHWVAVNGAVVFDLDRKAQKVTGITHEITNAKLIENELRETQLRVTSMLEAVDVGAWSLDLINDRVTPDQNLTRMFFLTDEEAHGSIENYLRRIHPDDRPTVETMMQKVFADPSEKYALDYRVVSRKGAVRWIHIRGDVERDSTGKPTVFQGLAWDVTRRKESEDAEKKTNAKLLHAMEKFRTLADAMPQMVWSAGPDGFVDYYNQRWLDYTGLSSKEMQGRG